MTQDIDTSTRRVGAMLGAEGPGMLEGLRVVEFADELGEYVGLLLAGLGADVVKVEPPAGARRGGSAHFSTTGPIPKNRCISGPTIAASGQSSATSRRKPGAKPRWG